MEPQDHKPTSKAKRIAALLGALFMLALSLLYAYSLATGAILAW